MHFGRCFDTAQWTQRNAGDSKKDRTRNPKSKTGLTTSKHWTVLPYRKTSVEKPERKTTLPWKVGRRA